VAQLSPVLSRNRPGNGSSSVNLSLLGSPVPQQQGQGRGAGAGAGGRRSFAGKPPAPACPRIPLHRCQGIQGHVSSHACRPRCTELPTSSPCRGLPARGLRALHPSLPRLCPRHHPGSLQRARGYTPLEHYPERSLRSPRRAFGSSPPLPFDVLWDRDNPRPPPSGPAHDPGLAGRGGILARG